MKINEKEVIGNSFAYEGCHKIYVCENKEDEEMMRAYGYRIYPISMIKDAYDASFIENAQLTKTYVPQFENAVFES